jgi:hypothetical protein
VEKPKSSAIHRADHRGDYKLLPMPVNTSSREENWADLKRN